MPNKFHAKKVEFDGYVFDSGAEHWVYASYLKPLLASGAITHLEVHPEFEVIGRKNLKKIFVYKADFRFFDREKKNRRTIDVKGYAKGAAYTLFRVKKKVVEDFFFPTIIEEWHVKKRGKDYYIDKIKT